MKQPIILSINGVEEEVWVQPWWDLAYVLREELNLIGTKVGCNTGNCGACTVLINGRAVKSCLYLAMKARGKDIVTIEGLNGESGKLHPLQEAFVAHHAVQCGYCTPGMILTAKALLDENPKPTVAEIKTAMAGNLCRCTGYRKIVDAVQASAKGD